MDLNELLDVFERTAANLAKLEAVWERAQPLIPQGPSRGSSVEYDDLSRTWHDLLPGLPLIDGWTITDDLPDIDEMGSAFIEYAEIDEPASSVYEVAAKSGRDLGDYRYRLNRARRQAARDRLLELITLIDGQLPVVVQNIPRTSGDHLETEASQAVAAAIKEIERLIGDSVERQGRWNELHRHLSFSEGHDWHDIREMDWPSVRPDVEAALFSDTEPIPVPEMDLGKAAADRPTGPVTTALKWDALSAEGFERPERPVAHAYQCS
jgi:hypothetical protein